MISKIFSSEELAMSYAENHYYPPYKIEQTKMGNWKIKRFYCIECNTTSELNKIKEDKYICAECKRRRGK
jgi:hypothetical protein